MSSNASKVGSSSNTVTVKLTRTLDLNPTFVDLGKLAYDGLNRELAFGDTPRRGEPPCWQPAISQTPDNFPLIERGYWRFIKFYRGEIIMVAVEGEVVNREGKVIRSKVVGGIPSDDHLRLREVEQGLLKELSDGQ